MGPRVHRLLRVLITGALLMMMGCAARSPLPRLSGQTTDTATSGCLLNPALITPQLGVQ